MNDKKEAILALIFSLCGIFFLNIIPEIGAVILFLTGIYIGKKMENHRWRGL